jgi:hypothetical protein
MWERRNAYKILVGNPGGKKPLGRPRRRWEDIREVGFGGVDRTHLAWNRDRCLALVNTVMNDWVP